MSTYREMQNTPLTVPTAAAALAPRRYAALWSLAMRRAPAFALLLLIAAFLGLAAWDECELAVHDCPPACHLGCVDGCGVVTPPEVPASAMFLAVIETLAPETTSTPSLTAPRPEITPPRTA